MRRGGRGGQGLDLGAEWDADDDPVLDLDLDEAASDDPIETEEYVRCYFDERTARARFSSCTSSFTSSVTTTTA